MPRPRLAPTLTRIARSGAAASEVAGETVASEAAGGSSGTSSSSTPSSRPSWAGSSSCTPVVVSLGLYLDLDVLGPLCSRGLLLHHLRLQVPGVPNRGQRRGPKPKFLKASFFADSSGRWRAHSPCRSEVGQFRQLSSSPPLGFQMVALMPAVRPTSSV